MPQAHQLSAIMFTDIAGYTALMGEDEQEAFDVLNRSRQIQKPLIDQYHGRWLKEMGDGVLASFSSASDAVYCARAIQQQCRHEADLRLRIGIHLGDVVFEGNDVFGDGVNIAARLQAAAPVGDIWISEPVQSNVSNKKDIATEFVRTETLKHVKDPVRIYRVALDGAPTAHRAAPVISIRKPAKSTRLVLIAAIALVLLLSGYFVYSRFVKEGTGRAAGNSIAVLYFNNMSTDPEQEYFSDGITEEIIAHLARIDGLRVISRTSVLPYKDKPANLKKIAGELHVSTVLEGSVRKSGDAIRVTAQLINARTDEHIWVETFDRQLKDIFTLQSDIARSIARKFEVEISPEADAKISRLPTASVEAYDNFQKGIYFLYKKYLVTHQQEDFDKAKKHFERAIQLDPGYAEPYAGLAELYDELRNYNVKAFPDSLLQLKVQLA
ncbi:MAG TPA: adenylate/guanylate cyclase domain-containing protein, partial [Chitinophagaceae bacterium]